MTDNPSGLNEPPEQEQERWRFATKLNDRRNRDRLSLNTVRARLLSWGKYIYLWCCERVDAILSNDLIYSRFRLYLDRTCGGRLRVR